MRVLVITTLFPNPVDPLYAPFNRQQLSALGRQCHVEVVSPIPWFPGAKRLSPRSRSGRLHDVPARGVFDGVDAEYPRYPYVPKLGEWSEGPLYAAGLYRRARRHRGRVDVVLGSWAYPDGWASVVLARIIRVPAVIKLHGSDMNVVARRKGPAWMLRRMLPRATRVVAVSRRLKEAAVDLGVRPDRVHVVFNGVDRQLFTVRDRRAARDALGLNTTALLLLYVGWLGREKGVRELLDAFDVIAESAPQVSLAIVGDGPMRTDCESHARRHNGRIMVVGQRPHAEVGRWMNACDLLVLPSWNEGTPNVVLEALTCGRRVVASETGGIPDLLDDPLLGTLVPPRNAPALAAALSLAVRTEYDPGQVAARGSRGDWNDSAAHLREVLAAAIDGGSS